MAFGLHNQGFRGAELEQRVDEVLRRYTLETRHHPPHLLVEDKKSGSVLRRLMPYRQEIHSP